MHLLMVGVDHETAELEMREAFALSSERAESLLRNVHGRDMIRGCALLSTCNRSELYLSYEGEVPPDSVVLLCETLGLDASRFGECLVERYERDALAHLMQVAAGMRSQILGESQIITQVRAAIELARQAGTGDPLLETVFRSAVTAGKKIKTLVNFSLPGQSVASEAVGALAEMEGGLEGKKVLVVGNGATGRLAAEKLLARGCLVLLTQRRNTVPKQPPPSGCQVVPFENRHQFLSGCDAVVSATSSRQYTIDCALVRDLPARPKYFVDLAVPRDIDPEVAGLDGAVLWNIDAFRHPHIEAEQRRQFLKAHEIIEKELARFDVWRRNREHLASSAGGAPNFPVFINMNGVVAVIAGGGPVAARRAGVLLRFGAAVKVVSPTLSPDMEVLLGSAGLRWIRREVEADDLDGATLAVAATDDREANRNFGLEAKERGILVSVADRREECSFYFPAVVQAGSLTVGLASNNGDHALVKRVAARLRQGLETLDEKDDPYRNAGKRAGAGAGADSGEAHSRVRSGVWGRAGPDQNDRRPHSRQDAGSDRRQRSVRQGTRCSARRRRH